MRASKQVIRQATDLFRACLVNGMLDEGRIRKTVRQMAASKPRGYLATLAAFRRLVKLESGRHIATVESARPLPADLQAAVVKSLGQTYGPGLSASFAENPDLLGGIRIQVGSDVYDGSIAGRLAALERNF